MSTHTEHTQYKLHLICNGSAHPAAYNRLIMKNVSNKWACLVTLRDQKRLKLIDAKTNLYIQMLG